MLAVVEHEQQRARREVLDHCVERASARTAPARRAQRRPHPGRVRRRVSARELDQSRTIRVGRLHFAGQLEGEPRLAHTAGPGEAEQARVAKQRLQLGQLAAAPNERARIRGQGSRPVRVARTERRRAQPRAPPPAPQAPRAVPPSSRRSGSPAATRRRRRRAPHGTPRVSRRDVPRQRRPPTGRRRRPP